jgi:hypothetical protein
VCMDVCTEVFVGFCGIIKSGLKLLFLLGGRTRTRTLDPLIKSLMLSLTFHSVSCKGREFVVVQDQSVRSKL